MANEKRLIDANALKEKAVPEEVTGEGIVYVQDIDEAPTVDAVEVADMKEFAEDVAYQFGYYCQNGGRLHITHGGLSTLEWSFDILGWENPHPVPECECEIEGCHEHATCGTKTNDGYKRVCGKHFAKMDGDGNGRRRMITYEERQQVYTNALIAYGEEKQCIVALEELSECAKEICKALRGKGDREHLAEEIADARICLEQMIYFFGLQEDVDRWMDSKIKRLDKKLKRSADDGK